MMNKSIQSVLDDKTKVDKLRTLIWRYPSCIHWEVVWRLNHIDDWKRARATKRCVLQVFRRSGHSTIWVVMGLF